jgi:acyl-CoA thioester hydrolase
MAKQAENNSEYLSSLEFTVRDYECDLQGIVNNANYQHYLEHARHEFLLTRGISFARLHDEGTDLIITKVEIDYKFPLRSRDRFIVKTGIRKEGYIRLVFIQDIYRLPDEILIVRAKVTGAATKKGRPSRPDDILRSLNL